MDKEELKKRYDKLVAEIESMNGYDGRGKGVDVYVCEKCGEKYYTRYKDKGVTPFTIRCRREACDGTMIHREKLSEIYAQYKGLAVHNWVRPTFGQFQALNDGGIEHVLNGGLMLEDELTCPESKERTSDKEEPVSEDLEEAAEAHALKCHTKKASAGTLAASIYDFKAGAQWKENNMIKGLWHKGTEPPNNKHPYPVINTDTMEMAFAYYHNGWQFDRDYNPGRNMLWLDIEKILPKE